MTKSETKTLVNVQRAILSYVLSYRNWAQTQGRAKNGRTFLKLAWLREGQKPVIGLICCLGPPAPWEILFFPRDGLRVGSSQHHCPCGALLAPAASLLPICFV